MPPYSVNFVNNTESIFTMCVYQTIPGSPGLESVAWQQTTGAPGDTTGVQWNINYSACLGSYAQTQGIGVYTANQTLPTNLGTAYDIVMLSNGGSGPMVQSLIPTTDPNLNPPANGIYIRNVSNNLANPGIGMSGAASVFLQGVYDPEVAQFIVTPTYWVALFSDLEVGEVISSDAALGPWQVQFGPDQYAATLTATLSGSEILTNIAYSASSSALSEVNRAIAAKRRRRAA
jgi:hypothetical protein